MATSSAIRPPPAQRLHKNLRRFLRSEKPEGCPPSRKWVSLPADLEIEDRHPDRLWSSRPLHLSNVVPPVLDNRSGCINGCGHSDPLKQLDKGHEAGARLKNRFPVG